MAKNEIPFDDVLLTVNASQLPLVRQLHDELVAQGCKCEIQSAKSGYVTSFRDGAGKALANLVTRKPGQHVRIYADNLAGYSSLLDDLPEKLRAKLAKASVCRRMLDPCKCNARCPMGYVFTMDGETHKKCRYNCFLWLIDEESFPHVSALVNAELAARV